MRRAAPDASVVTVRFRPLPGPVPLEQRLRRMLKYALRGCGLRNAGFVDPTRESDMSRFQKAAREESKLRFAIIAPPGGGKTYTALRLATLLGGRIALIDTERKSASKYAPPRGEKADPESGTFEFESCGLSDFSPQRYVEAIHDAEAAGFDWCIVDSLSHAWIGKGGALEMHDEAVDRQKTKNTYTAWRDVTPAHNALVDALVQSPCHVIVTMRAKVDYVQEKDEHGKTTVRKVGLAPIQRDGLEYEFDVVGDMDTDNKLVIGKTRCRALRGKVYREPGQEFADVIKSWLAIGQPKQAASQQLLEEYQAKVRAIQTPADWTALGLQIGTIKDGLRSEHLRLLRSLYVEARPPAQPKSPADGPPQANGAAS